MNWIFFLFTIKTGWKYWNGPAEGAKMTGKLLLVDDDEKLIEGIAQGLGMFKYLFDTFTCYSVDEAITLSTREKFDLIISDLKMPGKSGIDLMMHLKSISYEGSIMVMTAYGNDQIFAKISELGGMTIILKPFNMRWFKEMVVDFFKKKQSAELEEKRGFSGQIDSIGLSSLLQLIHLEKKTVAVKVDIKDNHGFIFFKEGEVINAEFDGVRGIEAAVKLVRLNSGEFSVIQASPGVENEIVLPFIGFMQKAAGKAGEDQSPKLQEGENHGIQLQERVYQRFQVDQKLFAPLTGIREFRYAAVFDQETNLMAEECPVAEGKIQNRVRLTEIIAGIIPGIQISSFNDIQINFDQVTFHGSYLVPQQLFLGVLFEANVNLQVVRDIIQAVREQWRNTLYDSGA